MKVAQIILGAVICVIGALTLVIALRDGGAQIIGPLSLLGAGALAISSARKRK